MDDDKLSPERKAAVERARKGLMNIESQEIYDELINKNPRELNPNEQQFLTARRGYMNDQQLKVFQDMIDQVLAANEPVEEEKPPVVETETDENGVYIAKKDRK